MDDLVVILLTLLILGIGAINQFRKKQKEPVHEKDTGSIPEQKNFWEEFMDMKREDLIPHPVPQHPSKETRKTEDSPKEAAKTNLTQEGIRMIQDESLKEIKLEPERKKANLPEGFTLRKAVIFSEILKPKYF
jgi:hypothetical protein